MCEETQTPAVSPALTTNSAACAKPLILILNVWQRNCRETTKGCFGSLDMNFYFIVNIVV